jgi:hypothetical protein
MQDLFCGAPLLSRSYAFSFVRALGPASVIYDRIFGRSEQFCSDGEEFYPLRRKKARANLLPMKITTRVTQSMRSLE